MPCLRPPYSFILPFFKILLSQSLLKAGFHPTSLNEESRNRKTVTLVSLAQHKTDSDPILYEPTPPTTSVPRRPRGYSHTHFSLTCLQHLPRPGSTSASEQQYYNFGHFRCPQGSADVAFFQFFTWLVFLSIFSLQ